MHHIKQGQKSQQFKIKFYFSLVFLLSVDWELCLAMCPVQVLGKIWKLQVIVPERKELCTIDLKGYDYK